MKAAVSAHLLASLEVITHETTKMRSLLDDAHTIEFGNRREAKRRAAEIEAKAQEFFDWISAARLEETTH